MTTNKVAVRTKCPSCQRIIELERRHRRKELITCRHCQTVLEVIREYPQVVDFPLDPNLPSSRKKFHRLG